MRSIKKWKRNRGDRREYTKSACHLSTVYFENYLMFMFFFSSVYFILLVAKKMKIKANQFFLCNISLHYSAVPVLTREHHGVGTDGDTLTTNTVYLYSSPILPPPLVICLTQHYLQLLLPLNLSPYSLRYQASPFLPHQYLSYSLQLHTYPTSALPCTPAVIFVIILTFHPAQPRPSH